jgi:uncharacterized membrane protein YjgN (DUF898 family)
MNLPDLTAQTQDGGDLRQVGSRLEDLTRPSRVDESDPVTGDEPTADRGAEANPENNLMVLAPSARGNEAVEPFAFTGTASEYFRIWIVNTFLTIATIGLWSPWAKIRKRRFFLRNTWVADANFEYHARPWPIFWGRLIAGAAFVAYWFAGEMNPRYAPWVALAVAIVAPWVVLSSMRFNLSNTSYRNLRFAFEGSIRDTMKALWPIWLFAALAVAFPPNFEENISMREATLMAMPYFFFAALYPYLHGMLRLLVLDHSRYGAAPIRCTTRVKTFYTIYTRGALVGGGLYVAAVVLTFAAVTPLYGVMSSIIDKLPAWFPIVVSILFALPIACAGTIWYAFTQSRLINATFNLTTISTNVRIFSKIKTMQLVKLYLVNTLAAIFSLGLAIPWAAVRTAKLRVETTALAVTGDIDDIIADAVPRASAAADAGAEFFSLDVAL